MANLEGERLAEADGEEVPWRDWGPYLAERAWGTVREDYSADGNAWDYFPHDHARSRTYRWSEDGLAGVCDRAQTWCLGLAFWNGQDPILKERVFGLTVSEGNHGQDAKELWWYLDSTPTHSWMRWRYVYPQLGFPYEDLRAENGRRNKSEPEYELADTGVLADNRYWLVTADFAKAAPHDLCLRVTVENRGPEEATADILPVLWFRNTWAWDSPPGARPVIRAADGGLIAEHESLGRLTLAASGAAEPLCCDNETNSARLFGVQQPARFPKDGISDHVVTGAATVNPEGLGTKAALRYRLTVPAGAAAEIRLRLCDGGGQLDLGEEFGQVLRSRQAEAASFYADLAERPAAADDAPAPDEQATLRAAAATLLWSKQFYHYDVTRWLDGDPGLPPPPKDRNRYRNAGWRHLSAADVVVVPEAWEYPWLSAQDLALSAVGLAWLDPALAKEQLLLLTGPRYAEPRGPLPEYEWDFGECGPPLLAHAALRVFEIDGSRDLAFLHRMFEGLIPNFLWWVAGPVTDQLDVPSGSLTSAARWRPLIDRTTLAPISHYSVEALMWAGLYCLALLRVAVILQQSRGSAEMSRIVTRLVEYAAELARSLRADGWWDDEDGFFYGGVATIGKPQVPLRLREIQGLLAVAAVACESGPRAQLLRSAVSETAGAAEVFGKWAVSDPSQAVLALADPGQVLRLLAWMESADDFLSPFGLRSLSRFHRDEPLEMELGSQLRIAYEPGPSRSGMLSGNVGRYGAVLPLFNWLLYDALARLGERQDAVGRRCGPLAVRLRTRLLSALHAPELGHGTVFPEYVNAETGEGCGAMHSAVTAAIFLDLFLRDRER
jgi:hypothetical protein